MGRRRASTVLASSRVQGGIDAGVRESRIGSALIFSRARRRGWQHSEAQSTWRQRLVYGLRPDSRACSAVCPRVCPRDHRKHVDFPGHFNEGGFTKTVAFGTTKARSWKCRLHVYLPSAVRWPSGRRRRFAKPLYDLKVVPRVRIPASPPFQAFAIHPNSSLTAATTRARACERFRRVR